MVPYKWLSEMMRHLFGLKLSEGSIANILRTASGKAKAFIMRLKKRLGNSKAVGAYETSCKVKGQKQWIWIWQTEEYTFISPQSTRSGTVVQSLFPEGLKNACLISDRYTPHLSTPAFSHQLCLVHLLRELQYLCDLEQTQWATDFAVWINEAIALKKIKKTLIKNRILPL